MPFTENTRYEAMMARLDKLGRGKPGERKLGYLQYDDSGMLAKVVTVEAGEDQMETNTMLLNAIEDTNTAQQKHMMKACMAACLEALNYNIVTIDTVKLATIWDRIECQMFSAEGQPGIVHYAINKIGAPQTIDPFNIAAQAPQHVLDLVEPKGDQP